MNIGNKAILKQCFDTTNDVQFFLLYLSGLTIIIWQQNVLKKNTWPFHFDPPGVTVFCRKLQQDLHFLILQNFSGLNVLAAAMLVSFLTMTQNHTTSSISCNKNIKDSKSSAYLKTFYDNCCCSHLIWIYPLKVVRGV